MMSRGYLSLCGIILWFWCDCCSAASKSKPFDDNYIIDWGAQQFTFLDAKRTQVQIQINESFGGGGFRSKETYGSGYFKVSLKIPKNSKGIASTFYLTSLEDNEPGGAHDELDFELLGSNGPPYTLNTNIFAQDGGGREQQFNLWFDPTSDFHDYVITWNTKQIVFYVDNIPVRVSENKTWKGAKYPNQAMYVHGTLWNGTQWMGPTNWGLGPFYANYMGFEVYGCTTPPKSDTVQNCASKQGPWNEPRNRALGPEEKKKYMFTRKKYMTYDYCKKDLEKKFPECWSTGKHTPKNV